MRYRVEFEGNDEVGYSAYLPEFPGCVAAGETFEETKALLAKASDALWTTSGTDRQITLRTSEPVTEWVRSDPGWPKGIIAVTEISAASNCRPRVRCHRG